MKHVNYKLTQSTFSIVSLLLILCISFSVKSQLSETFDYPGLIGGWSAVDANGSTFQYSNWQVSSTAGHPISGASDHTGNGGNLVWVKGGNQPNVWKKLESPAINFTSTTNLQLSFWMYSASSSGNSANTFWVDWFDGTNWNDSVMVYADSTINNNWQKFTVDLSGYPNTGSNQRVRFMFINDHPLHYYHGVAIDDIKIKSVVDNDALVLTALNPQMPTCTQDSVVRVVIKNNGFLPLTAVNVDWSVNNVAQSSYAWTGSLTTDETDTVLLSNNAAVALGSNLKFSTSLPNGVADQNPGNDEITLGYNPGVSGVFTVDSISLQADFKSIQAAVNSLNQYGICGNVVIKVAPGTYNGAVLLDNIPTGDTNSSIVIESASGNASDVIIKNEGTSGKDDFALGVFNMRNVTIQHITIENTSSTYALGVKVFNVNGLKVKDCIIKTAGNWSGANVSVVASLGASQLPSQNILIKDNSIENGSAGILVQAPHGQKAQSVNLVGNRLINQKGNAIDVTNASNLVVSNNYYHSVLGNSNVRAIRVYSSNKVQVIKNHIQGNTICPSVGIQVQGVAADSVFSNVIANNRVSLMSLNSLNGIVNENSDGVLVAHNSVYIGPTNYNANAFKSGWNNQNLKLYNNAFQAMGNNSAIQYDAGQIAQSDYNVLTVENGSVVKQGYTLTFNSIADWTAASGFDSNSFEIQGVFPDKKTLKSCEDSLVQAGTPLVEVLEDCDGDPRSALPCIGADEFKLAGGLQPIADFELCNNEEVTFKHPFADTVVWNGDTLTSVSVNTPGQYAVTAISTCESISYSLNVLAFNPAELPTGGVCEGSLKELTTGVSNATYEWSTGATDSIISIDTTALIWVKVTSADGCISSDTMNYEFITNVVLSDSTVLCEGSSVSLSANVPGTYLWSNGSTAQFITIFNPGVYSVTATQDGCASADTTRVEELKQPVANFVDSNEVNTVFFTNTSENADNYYWEFGDGNNSQDEHPTHTYNNPGNPETTVTVVLHVGNVCGDDSKTNFDVEIGGWPTGISELENSLGVDAFPNPTTGAFSITSDADGEIQIQVLTLSGQVVATKNVMVYSGQVVPMNLNNVASGIYVVKVKSGDEVATLRLIKR